MVALTLSSLATYSEQILLMAVLTSCSRWCSPGRCSDRQPVRPGADRVVGTGPMGFAATASTVDVHDVNLLPPPMIHGNTIGQWLLDMGLLAFGRGRHRGAALAIEAASARVAPGGSASRAQSTYDSGDFSSVDLRHSVCSNGPRRCAARKPSPALAVRPSAR